MNVLSEVEELDEIIKRVAVLLEKAKAQTSDLTDHVINLNRQLDEFEEDFDESEAMLSRQNELLDAYEAFILEHARKLDLLWQKYYTKEINNEFTAETLEVVEEVKSLRREVKFFIEEVKK